MTKRLILFVLLLVNLAAFGQVRMARIFSDHVVLQRQQPIPVWGWAKPGETVKATLAGQTQQAKADANGKWLVRFTPLEAGGPHTLAATAKSGSASAADVLIGEVWLCSGQSNMEWPVRQANNFATEKKNANFPQIRHFRVEHELALTPQTELKSGDWKVASSETVGDFTAVGFFFARELYQKLNIPIGLMHSSWGGSQVEGWISKEGMMSNDELRPTIQNLPTTWQAADSLMDLKLRQQLKVSPTLTAADEQKYLDPNYDFAGWRKTDPMGQWEWKDLKGFVGQGYMARIVDIPDEMVTTQTTLGLAENDSPNKVYINGKLISEGVVNGIRKMTVPANTWKAGQNRIVVKMGGMVNPSWYGLGLKGSGSDLYLEDGLQRISLANDWRILPSFAEKHEYKRFMNNVAISIYNAMIAPLEPMAMRGVLWYQGETNAGRSYQYRQSFPLLITNWRQKFGQNMSFYFVQLSSYGGNQNSNQGSGWAELREAQTMTLSLPKTGMAVITDIGNPKDIHPTNKQDVGHRLALNALKLDYGQTVNYSSPMYDKVAFEGDKAIVTFKNGADDLARPGLMVKDKYGYLKGFELAGDDKVFYYAQAQIKGNTVVVSHPNVPKPVAVRYAWTDAPEEANLFSSDGLPANPFRTDNWPGVTVKAKFE